MRFRSLFHRRQADRDLHREFQFHLDRQIEENIAAGMPPEEARYAALRTMGAITQLREECRDMRRVAWFENSLQDLQYALRALARTPAFTLVAVLSLALGIGANTAVFSVVQAVLVRNLPYPDSNRLVHFTHAGAIDATSLLEYAFVKEHATSFVAVAAHSGGQDQTLTAGGNAEWITTLKVSPDFFRTLGMPPAIGREFLTGEGIILTDALWRKALAADASILGRNVMLNGVSYPVIGILPANFWFSSDADAFLPLRPSGAVGDEGFNSTMIGRLKPGIDIRQADAELAALSASFRRANSSVPDDYKGLATVPYRQWLVGDVRTTLLMLFGAVLLLLTIACSNLASLLFARLTARRREIAVRLALGCSSARLLRLFLMENAIIVFSGCAAGLAAAAWSLDALVHLFPFKLPASAPIALDLPVLAFTFAIAIATGLAFSIAPFLMSARVNFDQALKSGRSQAGVRQRVRGILVITEVALSTAMLGAAALLIATLYREHSEPLGFNSKDVLTFWTPPAKSPALEATLLERIRAIPGVRSAASANMLPLDGRNNYPTQREGHPDQSIGGMEIRIVSPSYFETMGIRMVRGRPLRATDSGGATPVILVNETLAKQWWPDGNFAGSRVLVGRFHGKIYSDSDPPREVIGVAADTKSVFLKQPPRPTVYLPAAQTPWMDGGMEWLVRADLTPELTRQLRQAVASVDPGRSVQRVRTMEEIVAKTMADSRFDAWLFGIFAGLALLLTAIGVYGLLAFFVTQRTNEIGIRLALGATRGGVLALVLKQGVALIVIGLAVGLAGALALTRLFATLLFGVSATDPWTFAAVTIVLLAVGMFASLIPARRASKVDPMIALRYE